jgi:class 3 adenylate cyclase/tetratricopeptide (TPR) repeat protein
VRCVSCGEDNPGRAKFCLACGSPLASPEQEVRKTVTVLFCDLVGSTALGERLDPETIRRVMSRYFGEMQAVLERHGGTVEKFVGDAIMAVFGVPVTHEDDALRALHAASEMRERLTSLNDELQQQWAASLRLRIGVNTGDVIAGDPSRNQAFVSGDAVNVAARLEQAAGPGEILMGEVTRALGGDAITAEPIAPVEAKGKTEPVVAWRLVDVRPQHAHDRSHDTPFVGRREERNTLELALGRAIDERSCILATVVGPPGIGKSRLIREFVRGAADRTRSIAGRCLPYGEGITYWPLAEIVKGIGGETQDELVALLGGDHETQLIAERVTHAVGSGAGGTQPEEIFWAFRKLFERLAANQPLIAVIDDIHWAEPTLLDLLEYVAAFSTDAQILLLCLARAELFDQRPSWAAPKQNAVLMQLQPFSQRDTETLIDGLLGDRLASEDARDRIAEAAEGNPFFIEQLLALNAELADSAHVVLPPTIQALLSARIDRLDQAERSVIERAAVEGHTFHRGAVSELLDEQARASIGSSLISLVRKEFIRPDRTLFPGDDAFRFGHILIRDAAYEGVPKQLRAELHERFAAWLERVAGARATDYDEILAYHLEQAYRNRAELGPIDDTGARLAVRAAERLATVGRRAFARSDMPATINLLSRAADLLSENDVNRLELLPELATALMESGDLDQAAAVAAEAAAHAHACELELIEWRARLVLLSLQLWRVSGNDDVNAGATRAAEALERLGDEIGLARAWHLIGLTNFWLGRGAPATEAFERALAHAQQAGAQREESESLTWLLIATWSGPTPAEEGIRRCRQILEAPPDRRSEAFAFIELGVLLAMQERVDEGRDLVERGRTALNDLGLKIASAGTSQELFDLEMLADRPEAAEVALRSACDVLEEMGEKGFLSTRLGCLAEAIYAQGRFDEAEDASRLAEAQASDAGDLDAQYRWRAVRAKTLARRGDFAAADRLAREAADLIHGTDWINNRAEVQLAIAEVLRLADRDAEAIQAIEEAIALYEQKQNHVGAKKARGLLAALQPSRPTLARSEQFP